MKISPGTLSPPVTDIATSNKLARVSGSDALPQQLPGRSAEQISRELAQVVARGRDGLAQLRNLANGNLLNLQTQQTLNPGQLVLLETTSSSGRVELNVQSSGSALVNQILKLLVPSNGNLKTLLQNVVQTQGQPQAAHQLQTSGPTSPNPGTPPGASATSRGLFGFLNQTQNLNTKPSNADTSPTPNTSNGQVKAQTSPVLQTLKSLIGQQLNSSAAERGSHTPFSTAQASTVQTEGSLRNLIQQLAPTGGLRAPEGVALLLQPGQTPPLLKLILPILRGTLNQAPLNAEQAQTRDHQLSALTQLTARILLGAIRAPNAGNEIELTRSEWITRFEQSLDSLQLELSINRDTVREREGESPHDDTDDSGKIKQWRVRLAFEFPELGAITAFVFLSDQQKMEVQFWAESDQTRRKLEHFRSDFNRQLNSAVTPLGIAQLNIDVYEGKPPPAKRNITTQLIDETA